MDDLDLTDVEGVVVGVVETTFLGKRAFIRNLTFDGQVLVHKRFGTRLEDDATPDDMRALCVMVLCDAAGNLLFTPVENETYEQTVQRGIAALAKVDGDEMQTLFAAAQSVNGWDVEEEIKN
jgi:hypothetical protein